MEVNSWEKGLLASYLKQIHQRYSQWFKKSDERASKGQAIALEYNQSS